MDCPGIPEIRYSDWSAALHEKVAAKRIPVTGSIELTFRCNNSCTHCYCNKPPHDREELAKELSAGEIFGIIDDIVDEGCLWLLFTGGEPLLRPDFKEIYIYAKSKGMIITLFTNGTLINDQIAAFLAEWKPLSVEITLYGATETTYEGITRVPGSYRRCVKGIETLIAQKVPLKLKTMAMRRNVHEIPLMKRYAEDMGLGFRFDPMINARLDMDKGPLAERLDAEEVVRLDREDARRSEEWKEFCRSNMGSYGSGMLYPCGAGSNAFHIDPHGGLSMCLMARKDVYDLRAGTFREGWSTIIRRLKERLTSPNNRCRKCKLSLLCGQCPGWAQVEHGDDESPVDFLCEVAHSRAQTFSIKLADQ